MIASVIIPAYGRPGPLRQTLRSARAAAAALGGPAEVIVVDDGSSPPLRDQLGPEEGAPLVWLRQQNQGSIAARAAGLAAARGEYILFLDSDDLIHPDKLRLHADAMAGGADISYSDMAEYRLEADGSPRYSAGSTLPATSDPLEFFLRIQPAPHNPVYRRDYLQRGLAAPLVPPRREFDPVGDVWIFYNLLPHPARVRKVDAPLSAVGRHEEGRYSSHWEKLGLAALRLMEAFDEACPRERGTARVRAALGACAFESWRRLPRDFNRDFDRRTLALWRRNRGAPLERLGGRGFRLLARACGPELAGRALRRIRGGRYAESRTLSGEEYSRLFPSP